MQVLDCRKLEDVHEVKLIGKGTFGEVFKVQVQGTFCAAKKIRNDVEDILEVRPEKFLKECARSCQLLHPNIVQCLGVHYPNQSTNLPWLIMELMYITLYQLIKNYKHENFPFCFKLSILLDICEGVRFLHSQKLIHRDLTSNNILLTKHLVAKIADFGTAKRVKSYYGIHTTDPGTPNFMPPEVKARIAIYHDSVDVFSLGCICLHLISMQYPLPSIDTKLNEMERRQSYMKNELVTCSELKKLVEGCLHDCPDERPKISDVILQLESIKNKDSICKYSNIIELLNNLKQRYEKIL